VQGPHKGCFGRWALRCVSVEAKRRSIDTLSRRRIRRAIARTREAGERRPGEIRVKAFVAGPRGANPMGGAGSRRIKTPYGCKALPEGTNPETVARQAGLALFSGRDNAGRKVCGFLAVERLPRPSGRGNLRRVNPTSAAGVKQNRHGIRGSKPSRG
jgi:hypothetical protein